MKRVLVTPRARADLLEIWDFIAKDNAVAADRVLADIQSSFQRLAELPGMGHIRLELDPAYRVWRVYSYLIVYRRDSVPLQVIRVMSGHRDLKRFSP
jgi:plasmid stabilization system protein ParE